MWNQINNQTDIVRLQSEYFRFHDSCICSVVYQSGASVDESGSMSGTSKKCALVIRLDSQMPLFHHQPDKKSLELKFIGLRRMNLIGYQDNYFSDMLSCYLSFFKKYIVWSDDDGFDPENYMETELLNEPMSSFVIADRLEWRFVQQKS